MQSQMLQVSTLRNYSRADCEGNMTCCRPTLCGIRLKIDESTSNSPARMLAALSGDLNAEQNLHTTKHKHQFALCKNAEKVCHACVTGRLPLAGPPTRRGWPSPSLFRCGSKRGWSLTSTLHEACEQGVPLSTVHFGFSTSKRCSRVWVDPSKPRDSTLKAAALKVSQAPTARWPAAGEATLAGH